MANKTARRVYSTEQLHQLRSTVSYPERLREAIEEHDDEDAELVKEHVLRGSRSFAARSWKSRTSANSLRVPSNKENRSTNASESDRYPSEYVAPKSKPVLGEIAPNNQILRPGPLKPRPSPTPSIRRKKIESLVKAHGSPTHVRVTAGGRIVPSEQSPLCHPRYGYSAIQTNGGLIKLAPNHPVGNAQWTPATQNGFVAQDVHGQLCQIVDGTILPLTEVDGALRLFMPAPNLNTTQRGSSLSHGPSRLAPTTVNTHQRQQPRAVPSEPSIAAQINALELEYSKLDHELKDVDKTEVLHGRTMGKAAKDALIGKRRELVTILDNVRRALKSIKEQAPANTPASPNAMQKGHSMSPPRNRLPAFLHQRQQTKQMAMPPALPAIYGPFYGPAQPPPFPVPYGFQPMPSPDSDHNGQPWTMPPPAMFASPPPFDGAVSSASLPYLPTQFNAPVPFEQPAPIAPAAAPAAEPCFPQNDGSRSTADLQKVASPRQSHALPIKAPEHKGVKSSLNPMSPVYRPGAGLLRDIVQDTKPSAKSVKNRISTPLSPLHQLLPPSAARLRVVNNTDETISPTKNNPHLHSSSIDSFQTADFFPRNTREYSTRQYAYTPAADASVDKENADPQRHDSKQDGSPMTPAKESRAISHSHPTIVRSVPKGPSPQTGGFRAPAPPPSTPVDAQAAVVNHNMSLGIDDDVVWTDEDHAMDTMDIPDREAHNLSPKAKRREWLFVEEHPDGTSDPVSSSPVKAHACQEELCVTASPYNDVDFSQKPRDFAEGYQSGLNRHPPGFDRSADFLEGYCAALMMAKSTTTTTTTTKIGPSTGSPVKPISRRPSPVSLQSRSSGLLQSDRRPARPVLAPLENAVHSMDILKQAVFAPHNENALLTPAVDEPFANEPPFNLGAWAKSHESAVMSTTVGASAIASAMDGFQFPKRSSSVIKRQKSSTESHVGPRGEPSTFEGCEDIDKDSTAPPFQKTERPGNEVPRVLAPSAMPVKSIPSSSMPPPGPRISSITSVNSNLYRNVPGPRVFSPHLEWNSASSVAQHAGLATGFFHSAQFDGAPAPSHPPPAQRAASIMSNDTFPSAAAAPTQLHSRFKEGSLDGLTNPPTSPHPRSPTSAHPLSPLLSPIPSPAKDRSSKESSTKVSAPSPARTKFEHIAEKVGIKVAAAREKDASAAAAAGAEPVSPGGKRRWRDVWRGGSKRDSSGLDVI